jgi:hypothetical protein
VQHRFSVLGHLHESDIVGRVELPLLGPVVSWWRWRHASGVHGFHLRELHTDLLRSPDAVGDNIDNSDNAHYHDSDAHYDHTDSHHRHDNNGSVAVVPQRRRH